MFMHAETPLQAQVDPGSAFAPTTSPIKKISASPMAIQGRAQAYETRSGSTSFWCSSTYLPIHCELVQATHRSLWRRRRAGRLSRLDRRPHDLTAASSDKQLLPMIRLGGHGGPSHAFHSRFQLSMQPHVDSAMCRHFSVTSRNPATQSSVAPARRSHSRS
jgi:hypothetical protein